MTEVISVKFKGRGKAYYFDPGELKAEAGQQLVVETSKGLELADCVAGNHYVPDEKIVPPLRPVVRAATADDLRIAQLCKDREKEAFAICQKKIAEHGLDMKLVDVECNFEGSKILFFFTSDGRVDFRELVKDLAGIFRTRIELRQIGVRDEAKMLGGLGVCGRPFCCKQFLDDFQPVSTKMAKVQSLSLNPTKISGTCGRLMCCLRYEQEAYEELVKSVPKNGAFVETPAGYGNVVQVNLLRQKVKVKLDDTPDAPKSFDADEVAAIPGGRPKAGEPLPHILEIKEKPKEEPEESEWELPELFGEMPEEKPRRTEKPARQPEKPEEEKKNGSGGKRRSRPKKPSNGPKPEKPEAKKPEPLPRDGEKKPEGERKNSSNRRRRPKKPAGEQRQDAAPKARAEDGQRPGRPGNEQGKKQPRQDQASPAAEKGEGGKKNGNPNRRRYFHKPKSKPGGGEKQ